MKERPIFVPLAKDAFLDFKNTHDSLRKARKREIGKYYEIRKAEGKWNKKQLQKGREVVLNYAYRKPAVSGKPNIYGRVGQVMFGTLEQIFKRIPFLEIEPRAPDKKTAIQTNRNILGASRRYVAFEIIFTN